MIRILSRNTQSMKALRVMRRNYVGATTGTTMKNENTSANRSGFESGTGREQFQSKNKLLFRKRLRQPDFFSSYSTQQQTDRSQNFTKHETSQWQNNKGNNYRIIN